MRKYENGAYLQQLQGGGGGVGVLQLELGPGVVEDGKEGEVASVAPVATDDEQGAEDGKEDGKDNVEKVEPDVEREQLAAGAQGVLGLLGEVGVVLLLLHLSLLLSQGVFPLFSREELILLVISKLVGAVRLVAGGGSHFSTSSHCERLQWNDRIFMFLSDLSLKF